MLYARVWHGGRELYGVLDGEALRPITGEIFGEHEVSGAAIPVADVQILAPVRPGKVLAAAVNYHSHLPSGRTVLKDDAPPAIPQLFLKPSSSIVGPGDTILVPEGARRVDAEGEVVAVIGRLCRNVATSEALECVFGYTCGNDVSARHWQRDDIQWWRAKGSDTFSPIGPVIATGLDATSLGLMTRVNGVEVQRTTTVALIHGVAELISFASQAMTLEAGDLVFTGTPGETPTMNDGDVVEVEVEGVGVLSNPVRRQSDSGLRRT